jgi:hypothetical protein
MLTGTLQEDSFLYTVFSDVYPIVALVGGIWGLFEAKNWGGTKSVMGRAIVAFSAGLLFQVFGQVCYSFYFYVLGIENPYPSIGDFGFYATIPAYIYAIYELAKASGVFISLRLFIKTPLAIILPLLMLLASYEVFLVGYEFEGVSSLVVFLDFVNPLGQAIYISLALLTIFLSWKALGGVMRSRVILLLGAMVFQYLADFLFLYKTSRDVWVAGGISEYLYFVSYFVMTIAIVELSLAFKELKEAI